MPMNAPHRRSENKKIELWLNFSAATIIVVCMSNNKIIINLIASIDMKVGKHATIFLSICNRAEQRGRKNAAG